MNLQNAERHDLAREYANARARQRSARTRAAFDHATAETAEVLARLDGDQASCPQCGGPVHDCGSGCGL